MVDGGPMVVDGRKVVRCRRKRERERVGGGGGDSGGGCTHARGTGGGFDRTVGAGCALRSPLGDGTDLKALRMMVLAEKPIGLTHEAQSVVLLESRLEITA
ncbi:hypothetical protein PUN28_010720 [Cardiocondyla obscurior]|uniref:Uncharacterized protein n=1 Tax=Cardiocondyla obscurior TaxID=286306 RepID=A0AAW2FN39_9HYME